MRAEDIGAAQARRQCSNHRSNIPFAPFSSQALTHLCNRRAFWAETFLGFHCNLCYGILRWQHKTAVRSFLLSSSPAVGDCLRLMKVVDRDSGLTVLRVPMHQFALAAANQERERRAA